MVFPVIIGVRFVKRTAKRIFGKLKKKQSDTGDAREVSPALQNPVITETTYKSDEVAIKIKDNWDEMLRVAKEG